MEKYFNIQQLAKHLKMTESAVQDLVKGNKIPLINTPSGIVIFKKNDIDHWLEEKRAKVKTILTGDEII
ncbi:MAG: helix-turn-helix domain-containing protein [Nitrospirota bacterium]